MRIREILSRVPINIPAWSAEIEEKEISAYSVRKGRCHAVFFPAISHNQPEMAVSHLNTLDIEIAENFCKGQQLLAENQVTSPFIYKVLYYDEEGKKVSVKANGDLANFLLRDEASDTTTIKKMIGQLILAVEALHTKHLVHRDINLENILFSTTKEGIWIKLADLDSIIAVTSKGYSKEPTHAANPVCHFGYLPPAFQLTIFKKMTNDMLNQFIKKIKEPTEIITEIEKHNKSLISELETVARKFIAEKLLSHSIDFFTLDNHAVATCIDQLKSKLNANEVEVIKQIQDLSKALRKTKASISQAKNHKLFGNTPGEREFFFNSLINDSLPYTTEVNSYPAPPIVEKNDKFYLLPTEIQEIYFLVEKITDKLEFIKKNKSILETFLATFAAIQNNVIALNEKIEKTRAQSAFSHYASWLTELETEINSEVNLDNQGRNYVKPTSGLSPSP